MKTYLTSYRRPDGRRRRIRKTLGRHWVVMEVLTSRGIVSMCGKKWSGWTTWSIARQHGDVRLWPDDWSYEELRTMKRKTKPGADGSGLAQASSQTKLLAGLPHLVEHLNARQYDDGAMRQTGRLFVDCVGSMWRAVAKDTDTGMQLTVFMPSVDDALLQLELLLGSDEAPWEPDAYAKTMTPRKGKK